MYYNYRNRRLINNIGYVEKQGNFERESNYIHPSKSIHALQPELNRKIGYVDSTEHGVMMGAGNSQKGKGDFADTATGLYAAYNLIKEGAKAIPKMYGSKTATYAKNVLGYLQNEKYPNWRPGFPQEQHLITKTGVTYNYLGPHTALKERLQRGDPPLDGYGGIDACAQKHDIDYYYARNANDIRQADLKFMDCIDESNVSNTQKKFIKGLFKAKMIGEDAGVFSEETFTNFPNLGKDAEDEIEPLPSFGVDLTGKEEKEELPPVAEEITGQGIKLPGDKAYGRTKLKMPARYKDQRILWKKSLKKLQKKKKDPLSRLRKNFSKSIKAY